MRLTDEMIKEDERRYKSCNVFAELTLCGREVHHRKSITNDNIRFQAWLCRAAANLLKKQQAQFVQNIGQQIGCFSGTCPKCGKMLNTTCNKNFCGECGQAVKWDV